ncbi:hypothetical protein QAD02_015107 [Eretmocerus hayati]|uniref:Uncharacterized protein n=1 Tax=Eretmocerus hayati TaxID=131215 RepID=A0ACC2PC35_9HYME|nr:hypothetical protein QAD02_015107 [Eretmocerus hayati]
MAIEVTESFTVVETVTVVVDSVIITVVEITVAIVLVAVTVPVEVVRVSLKVVDELYYGRDGHNAGSSHRTSGRDRVRCIQEPMVVVSPATVIVLEALIVVAMEVTVPSEVVGSRYYSSDGGSAKSIHTRANHRGYEDQRARSSQR